MSPEEARKLTIGARVIFTSRRTLTETPGKVTAIAVNGRGPYARVITIDWDGDWPSSCNALHPSFKQIELVDD